MGPWQITLVEVRYKIDERAFIGEEDEILFVLQGPDGALERKAILRIQSTVSYHGNHTFKISFRK